MATDAAGNLLESWTVYTGNPKVGNSTLSISTTSQAYANAQLINVTSSTVTGQPYVDFVWKNQPMQVNDNRTALAAPVATVTTVSSSTFPGYLTYTTSAAHGFSQGWQVNVSGIAAVPVGAVGIINPLNVQNVNIDSVPTTTTFCVLSPLAASLSGLSGATATTIPDSTSTYGGTGNAQWLNTSTVASSELDFTKGPHDIAETGYSGFPNFKAADPILNVTAVSGNGTTVTYTAQSVGFVPGSLTGVNVTIKGLTNSVFNLTNATIASNTAYQFTVTSAVGSGVSLTGQGGFAQLYAGATDTSGTYGSGTTAYVIVPTVLGLTTANAQAALAAAELIVTTAGAAANTATQPTDINVTSATSATITVAGGTTTWPVGTSVTITAGTGVPAAVVGTWTVTGGTGSTLIIAGSGWTVADSGAITPGTVLKGTTGTIKTSSIAGGNQTTAPQSAITITPWA